MFWGVILKNEEEFELTSNKRKVLHISHAALVRRGQKDKVFIQLTVGNSSFVIGILSTNNKEFINLNYQIELNNTEIKSLKILNGSGCEVHVSGYFERDGEEEEKLGETENKTEENFEENYENQEGNKGKNVRKFSQENDNHYFEEDDSGKEEVDPGVDTQKLDTFLRRKIGKSEELKASDAKKLKKLNKTGEYASKTGTKYKPTDANLKKNNHFKESGGHKKNSNLKYDWNKNKKNYKSNYN